MAGRQRPTIAITISPELLDTIDKFANSAGLSRSRFIENLLTIGLEAVNDLEATGLWSASNLMFKLREKSKEILTQRKLFED
jgi:metal-responsive CopG/Arc/MetJ family transcriptional regulator